MKVWPIVLGLMALFALAALGLYSYGGRVWWGAPRSLDWVGSWRCSAGTVDIREHKGALRVTGPEAQQEGNFVPDQTRRVWQWSGDAEQRRVLEWKVGERSPVLRRYDSNRVREDRLERVKP